MKFLKIIKIAFLLLIPFYIKSEEKNDIKKQIKNMVSFAKEAFDQKLYKKSYLEYGKVVSLFRENKMVIPEDIERQFNRMYTLLVASDFEKTVTPASDLKTFYVSELGLYFSYVPYYYENYTIRIPDGILGSTQVDDFTYLYKQIFLAKELESKGIQYQDYSKAEEISKSIKELVDRAGESAKEIKNFIETPLNVYGNNLYSIPKVIKNSQDGFFYLIIQMPRMPQDILGYYQKAFKLYDAIREVNIDGIIYAPGDLREAGREVKAKMVNAYLSIAYINYDKFERFKETHLSKNYKKMKNAFDEMRVAFLNAKDALEEIRQNSGSRYDDIKKVYLDSWKILENLQSKYCVNKYFCSSVANDIENLKKEMKIIN
jgi:hypothetical protein